jgi:hypothetical protein
MMNEIKMVDFNVLNNVARESSSGKEQCFIGYQRNGSELYLLTGDLFLHSLNSSDLKSPSGQSPDVSQVEISNGGRTLRLSGCDFKSEDVLKVSKKL